MSSAIATSVIICTRDRADKLAACLKHLQASRVTTPFEIIIVDNKSRDQTRAVAEAFFARTSHAGRYSFCDGNGNGVGRNAGLQLAAGQIVLFTDDDCYPDPDWVEQWTRVFDDPTVGYGGGRILLHDPKALPLTINLSTITKKSRANHPVYAGSVQGANMAVRRSALQQAGLFDPDFGAGTPFAGEDWELVNRISLAGWSGGYFPAPTVSHDHGRTEGDRQRLECFYAIGEGALFAKALTYRNGRWRALRYLVHHTRNELRRGNWRKQLLVGLGGLKYGLFRVLHKDKTPPFSGGAVTSDTAFGGGA
jgi:GT2 family glycosyltransferase